MTERQDAQIVAGGFIGTMVSRNDLIRLKSLWKVAILVLAAYCSMNLLVGYCAHTISKFDLLTMLMCTIPGGLSDVPLIASELGINSPALIVVQVARLFVADAIMPQVCYTVAQMLG